MEVKKRTPFIDSCLEGVMDAKAKDIKVLDLREIENAVCDYFIICEGNSNTQVNAISNAAEKRLREELGEKPWHIEGSQQAEWILMDYVHVVVHVFQPEARTFYDLESLWGDARVEEIETNY